MRHQRQYGRIGPAMGISAAALAVSLKARLCAWMDGRSGVVHPCVRLRQNRLFRNRDCPARHGTLVIYRREYFLLQTTLQGTIRRVMMYS